MHEFVECLHQARLGVDVRALGPAPGARTRAERDGPPATSRIPAITVERLIPDASVTRAWPPRPNKSAAAPANSRRCRSSNSGVITPKNRARVSGVTFTSSYYAARVTMRGTLTVGEALACGTPVVITDVVGAGDYVSGPAVVKVPINDADALEAAVRTMLERIRAGGVGLRYEARRQAKKRFSTELVVRQIEEALEGVRS